MSHGVSASLTLPSHQAHNCLCCGAMYACEGTLENGDCSAVCEPCGRIEMGSQVSIRREVAASEPGRKRARIEWPTGSGGSENAYARRHKMNTNAGSPVAFGNLIDIQVHTPACMNAQGGGSHGE